MSSICDVFQTDTSYGMFDMCLIEGLISVAKGGGGYGANYLWIPEIFNANISNQLFDYTIPFHKG